MISTQKHRKVARKSFAAGTFFGALSVFVLLGGAFSSLGNAPLNTASSKEHRAVAMTSSAASDVALPSQANADRDVLDLQLD